MPIIHYQPIPGETVRSYDFPGNRECYVEGVCRENTGDEGFDKNERVKIEVTAQFWEGKRIRKHAAFVFPPRNGLRLFGDRRTSGIERVL